MQREIQRHFRRNFIANASDVSLWSFGFSFLSAATILPVYFAHLSSSTLLLGLIPALLDLGWFLPQLLTAQYVEKLSRKKPLVVVLGLVERSPFLLMAIGAVWFARLPAATAVTLFFGLTAIRALASRRGGHALARIDRQDYTGAVARAILWVVQLARWRNGTDRLRCCRIDPGEPSLSHQLCFVFSAWLCAHRPVVGGVHVHG